MKIYNYNCLSGTDLNVYIGESEARENPLEPGKYLIPAKATTIEPPEARENEILAFDEITKKWLIYSDNRENKTEKYLCDHDTKEIRNLTLEEKIKAVIITLDDTQKLNDDKTKIVEKTLEEKIKEGLVTLSDREKLSSDKTSIVRKTYNELVKDETLTEAKAEEEITSLKRIERDSELKKVLDKINQYENEEKQIELEIISSHSVTEEEYKKMLIRLQELRDFENFIDYTLELEKEA